MKYFFDTYALLEIIRKNPGYEPFMGEDVVTSTLNLGELYYALMRDDGKTVAMAWLEKLGPYGLSVGLDDIVGGMEFRFEHRKKGLSFIDGLGYCMARREGLVFLTGDKGFKDLPNVRYVK